MAAEGRRTLSVATYQPSKCGPASFRSGPASTGGGVTFRATTMSRLMTLADHDRFTDGPAKGSDYPLPAG